MKSHNPHSRKFRSVFQASLTFILTLFVSAIIIYKVESYAYVYAGLLWVFSLLLTAAYLTNSRLKLLSISFAGIAFSFLIIETFLSFIVPHTNDKVEVIYGGFFEPNEQIGFSLAPNSKWRSTWAYGDSISYDIMATTDQYGRRNMPASSITSKNAVVFLGCSFTFGNGVEDNESLPVRFQEYTNGNYKVFNLGIPGFGAHQTLYMLENEWEKQGLDDYTPKIAIYTGIVDHLRRGTSHPIKRFGPKYQFDSKGELKQNGLFSTYPAKIAHYLFKSQTFSFLYPSFILDPGDEDFDLIVAMIKKTSTIFSQRYGGEFYYVLWQELGISDSLYEKFLSRLKNAGINVIEAKKILPDYQTNREQYILYKESHPTAEAHKIVAKYLADLVQHQSNNKQ